MTFNYYFLWLLRFLGLPKNSASPSCPRTFAVPGPWQFLFSCVHSALPLSPASPDHFLRATQALVVPTTKLSPPSTKTWNLEITLGRGLPESDGVGEISLCKTVSRYKPELLNLSLCRNRLMKWKEECWRLESDSDYCLHSSGPKARRGKGTYEIFILEFFLITEWNH
jgi:hypothetical protein